jgi:flagellar hook-length control protein FliK
MKQGWAGGIPPAAAQNTTESAFGELLELAFMTVTGEGGPKDADAAGEGLVQEDQEDKSGKDEKGLNLCNAVALFMEDPQAMTHLPADTAGPAIQTLPPKAGALQDQAVPANAAAVLSQAVQQDPAKPGAAAVRGQGQEQTLQTPSDVKAGEPAEPGRSETLQVSDKAQNITAAQVQTADSALQAKELGAAAKGGLQKRSGEFQDHLENARTKVVDDKPADDKARPDGISPAAFGLEHRTEQLDRTEGVEAAAQELPLDPSGEDSAARQMGKATLRALRDGASEYRIQLHPEGLGRVEVTLVADHKTISLSMRTDNELARTLILDHAGDLRAQMSTQDYQLGALNVHVGAGGQGGTGFTAAFGQQAGQGIEARRGESGHDAPPDQAQAAPQEARRRYVPSNAINYRI